MPRTEPQRSLLHVLSDTAARELVPALYDELRNGIVLPAQADEFLETWSTDRLRARRSPAAGTCKALGFDTPPEERLLALALQGYLTLVFIAQARAFLGPANSSARFDDVQALIDPGPGTWTLAPGHPALDRVLASIQGHFAQLRPALPDPSWPGRLIELVVPPGFRRDLGEFYTPRWLAEQTLALAGWLPCEPAIPSVVDPTCGAGAFLVPAIQMARNYLALSGCKPDESAARVLAAIRGYDVNPLSVLACRVAYLSCLAGHGSGIELAQIPVHRRDVLLAPFESPLATKRASFVVGNPPGVRWSDLPQRHRQAVARAAKHYRLIPANTWHGGSEVDLSAVVAFASSDVDLQDGGRACFVLPRAHLHAPASSQFRSLRLPDGTVLGLCDVADFDHVAIFRGAAVQPVLMSWAKGRADQQPVGCEVWREQGSKVASDAQWLEARGQLASSPRVAMRLEPDSRIYLCAPEDEALARRLQGGTAWVHGRKGITTDLNGAFFVRILGAAGAPGMLRVVNDHARGTAVPRHEFEVEEALLYPLLKGAGQIERFAARLDGAAVIVPNHGIRKQLSEEQFRQQYPGAYEHFLWIERETGGALSGRSTYSHRMAKHGALLFHVYNVGDYTFSRFKVVWPEISSSFRCAVVSEAPLVAGSIPRPVVPDHKVYFAALDTEPQADFVCALLNTPAVGRFVENTTAHLQVGTVLRTLRIPCFNPLRPSHVGLAEWGRAARLHPDPTHGLEQLEELAGEVLSGDGS